MDTTLVFAGGTVIGGILLIPALMAFLKRNLPICFGLATTLLTIYCLAPYSAGAREVWTPISKIPADLAHIASGILSPVQKTVSSPSQTP